MKILMVTHFVDDFEYEGNNRFNYIASRLSEVGHEVEMITSNFSHIKKEKRKKVTSHYNYKITMLDEPTYKKNVSFARIRSHRKFSKNLKEYLSTNKHYDLIYCAIPSVNVAYETAKYAMKNKIKFIIDVQDLWPEAFRMVYKNKLLDLTVFKTIENKAKYVYEAADEIIGVSQTYVDRALSVNKKINQGYSVYLGTNLQQIDKYLRQTKKSDELIRIAYIGTLGHSYDLRVVIDALELLHDEGFRNYQFIIMGDGPSKLDFENYAKLKKINFKFTGRLDYPKMINILYNCDIAVNPIKSGSAASIINKVGDYAAVSLPVINTQTNQEYRSLLKAYNAGINCKNGDARDIFKALVKLIHDEDLRLTMGKNNRRMAEDLFDREKTYSLIIGLIK